jgi:hypothetical protein
VTLFVFMSSRATSVVHWEFVLVKRESPRQVAVELRLRAMQFSGDVSFVPTAAHVTLKDTNHENLICNCRQLPGYVPAQYLYLGYTIRELCEILTALLLTAQGGGGDRTQSHTPVLPPSPVVLGLKIL